MADRTTATRWAMTLLVAACIVFTVLPIVAIVLRVAPGELIAGIGDPAVLHAIEVSLRTTLAAHLIVLVAGTPVAWVLAQQRFRGRNAVLAVLELPIVLPPAVAGIGLLAAFGRNGLLGGSLGAFGIAIPYTQAAVVLAVVYVSGALYLRQAVGAFESVDSEQIVVARTLGAGPARVLVTIGIPSALPALEAASVLALARGFGEFGATIMFAGSLEGVTQTLPLAVYALLDVDLAAALASSVVLIALGVALLVANRAMTGWTRRSTS